MSLVIVDNDGRTTITKHEYVFCCLPCLASRIVSGRFDFIFHTYLDFNVLWHNINVNCFVKLIFFATRIFKLSETGVVYSTANLFLKNTKGSSCNFVL